MVKTTEHIRHEKVGKVKVIEDDVEKDIERSLEEKEIAEVIEAE